MASTTPVAATVPQFVDALKIYYHDKKIKSMMYDNRPTLALLQKRTDWTGYTWDVPLKVGGHQGGGGSFAQAKKFKRAGVIDKFNIPFVRAYQLADIDNALIDFSSNGDGSFIVDALENAVDDSILQFANNTALHLLSDKAEVGARGQVSGTPSGGVVVLAEPNDVINFEIGMVLSYGSDAATAAALADAALCEVTAVDREAGEVTVSGTAPADGDFLFLSGDEDNVLTGIGAYLWDHSAGAPPALHGMTRTSDPTRRAGLFYDATTGSDNTEDALRYALTKGSRNGMRKAEVIIVSPERFTNLGMLVDSSAAAGRSQYVGNDAVAKLGVKTIYITGAMGDTPVVADPYCPEDTGYILDLSTWSLRSSGTWGKFMRKDGRGRTNEDSDSMEIRFGGYGNLGCDAPGRNLRVKFVSL